MPAGGLMMAGQESMEGTMGQEVEPYVDEQGEILLAGPLAARLAELLETVPVGEEDGNAAIVEQLLSAQSAFDLNRPWDAQSGKELIGKQLRIDGIKLRPSRFAGGIRIFLVADCEEVTTGEYVAMTTSALAVIVQLARLNKEGWLPAYANVEVAEQATQKGNFPYHLRFVPPPAQVAK